jgi:SnoaL-like domain
MSDEAAAIEDIKRLKARYYRSMDTKQWDGWNDVFAPDATLDTTEEAAHLSIVEGREQIITFVSGQLVGVTTCHHGHMPEIELTSPSTANGIWAMEDHLWVNEGSELPFRHMHGYGHYHETYEKIGDRWYIKTLKLTRLRIDVETD